MLTERFKRRVFMLFGLATVTLATLIAAVPAWAEVRTITATGEYRMGDNDTRTDAKRLALLDAKRLALEQAGTYLESVTEVKNLKVSHDELRAYTAGIVEVIEQATSDVMDGSTHVVRVAITAKIDVAVMLRQVDALHRNEAVKAELLRVQQENDKLRLERDTLRVALAAARSKPEAEAVAQKRREVLDHIEVNFLLAQAWVALAGSMDASLVEASSSAKGRAHASKLLEKAISLDPNNGEAHHLRGMIKFEEGSYEAAIVDFRVALQMQPNDAHIRNSLGLALQAKGEVDDAIAEYHTALRLQPNLSETYINLGNVLADKGELKKASEAFHVALQLNPNSAEAHYNFGTVLYSNGDIEGAIDQYRTAIDLKRNSAEAHSNLGNALAVKGELKEAIAEFRMALSLNPELVQAHNGLGLALFMNNELDGAIAEYRTALRLKPDYAKAHYNIGEALAVAGRRAEAKKEFREYLRMAPDTPDNRAFIADAKTWLRKLER